MTDQHACRQTTPPHGLRPSMSAVTLTLSSRDETNRRFHKAFERESQGAFISFESLALLFKALTGRPWELLTDDGLVEFLFDDMHVDFTLKAA